MLADVKYTYHEDFAEIIIALQNGQKIIGSMDVEENIKIIENTTRLDEKHAELAAGIAYVMAKEHGEDYVVWKRFVDKVSIYKKMLDAARLNIN